MSRGRYCRRKNKALSSYLVSHQSQDRRGHGYGYYRRTSRSRSIEVSDKASAHDDVTIKNSSFTDVFSETDCKKTRGITMTQMEADQSETHKAIIEEVNEDSSLVETQRTKTDTKPKSNKKKWLVGLGVTALSVLGIILVIKK